MSRRTWIIIGSAAAVALIASLTLVFASNTSSRKKDSAPGAASTAPAEATSSPGQEESTASNKALVARIAKSVKPRGPATQTGGAKVKPVLPKANVGKPLDKSPDSPYGAPTASLTKIANALTLTTKSVTGVVKVPKGLLTAIGKPEGATVPPVLGPEGAATPTPTAKIGPSPVATDDLGTRVAVKLPTVEISVVYDGYNRLTENYNQTNGNRIAFQYAPLDGKSRTQKVQVSLYEITSTGRIPFQMPFNVTITPLYDVDVGPLSFQLVTDCDSVGASEPVVAWYNPDYSTEIKQLEMNAGQTRIISEFASIWREMALPKAGTRPLIVPQASWQEDDNAVVSILNSISGFPPSNDFHGHGRLDSPLLPGASHIEQWDLNDPSGSDCGAFLSYKIRYNLKTYPYL